VRETMASDARFETVVLSRRLGGVCVDDDGLVDLCRRSSRD